MRDIRREEREKGANVKKRQRKGNEKEKIGTQVMEKNGKGMREGSYIRFRGQYQMPDAHLTSPPVK